MGGRSASAWGSCVGELWFLSDLFVLPEAHGKGVGGELLQRCLAGGLERGARIRSVLSSERSGRPGTLHPGRNGSPLRNVRNRRTGAGTWRSTAAKGAGEEDDQAGVAIEDLDSQAGRSG